MNLLQKALSVELPSLAPSRVLAVTDPEYYAGWVQRLNVNGVFCWESPELAEKEKEWWGNRWWAYFAFEDLPCLPSLQLHEESSPPCGIGDST